MTTRRPTDAVPVACYAVTWVQQERSRRDVVVIGSLSLVVITFPVVVGDGDRLFATPVDLRFTAVEPLDAAALTVLRRDGRPA